MELYVQFARARRACDLMGAVAIAFFAACLATFALLAVIA